MEQLGKCKSKLSKIHHWHKERVKKDIFVDFSTKGVPSPPIPEKWFRIPAIFSYKIFIALKWSTGHETVSLLQQPYFMDQIFLSFVESIGE